MDYIKKREQSFDSLFFVRALPNEYLVRVGKKRLTVLLGGSSLRLFRRHLKVPASAEITQFELECSTSNYLGVVVRGFVSWKINPESVETAIRSLDFYNIDNPLEKTSSLIRDLANDAVRRSIAEIKVNDILNSSEQLKASIEKILEDVSKWGLLVETIGIHKIFIKSESVYNQLQAEERNQIKLKSELSNLQTESQTEKGRVEHEKQVKIQKSELIKTQIEEEMKQKILQQEAEIKQKKLQQETEIANIHLEKEKERQQLELSKQIEAERYAYEKERLQHDEDLHTIQYSIQMKDLDLKERERVATGGLTDREFTEMMLDRIEGLTSLYKNSNLMVFGDKTEAMSAVIAPIQSIAQMIKEYLATSKEVPGKKNKQ